MPTYVYRRADGTRFEHQQRITEDALTVCPTTGQAVTRIPSASAGLVFKGSGFYLTDYARSGSGSAASTGSDAPSGDSGVAKTDASTPPPAAPAAPAASTGGGDA